MHLTVRLLLPALLLLGSCAPPYVCPAYQSAFIHDKTALQKHFSYFVNDSTPKMYEVRKTRYLIAEPVSYRKRNREMKTVKMEKIYPVLPDPSVLDSLGKPTDSLAVVRADSIAAAMQKESGLVPKSLNFKITKTKEKYNEDQEYYMWFLRKSLVLPDIRYHLLKQQEGREAEAAAARAAQAAQGETGKKGIGKLLQKIGDFFRRLFGRKNEPTPASS